MANTCGIDWSERHHDVAIVNQDGAMVARARVSHNITGFGQLVELLAEHAAEPTSIEIAIESDKGLLVAALRAAGFVVFAMHHGAPGRLRVSCRRLEPPDGPPQVRERGGTNNPSGSAAARTASRRCADSVDQPRRSVTCSSAIRRYDVPVSQAAGAHDHISPATGA